ncbi:MAG: tripartite tricarboxylate transporter permease, partial [Terriglobia bacterium]
IGMVLIGYFAIKALVKVLDLKEAPVSAFVVMFCFIGALAARNNVNDLWTIVAFGGIGYLFEKFRFPIAPMVLGTILGPLAENYFLTAMISAQNDWTVFFTRPVSLVLVLLSAATIVFQLYRTFRESRFAQ